MKPLTCQWKKLAFANYIASPEILQQYLPSHTELDYLNGKCFVSLVGFQFKNVEIAGIKVPGFTNFEEVNLRTYVRYFDGQKWRHGTVFISEIADRKLLSLLANSLFHESYRTMPTKHTQEEKENAYNFGYQWKFKNSWQSMEVKTGKNLIPVQENSDDYYFTHRLWGYGKHSEKVTNEYKISHPVWPVYEVKNYAINVDFTMLFGSQFSHLSGTAPYSVILAEGSEVIIEGSKKVN